MKKIEVNLEPSYPIVIENNLLNSELLINYFRQINKPLIIITDSNIKDLYGKVLQQILNCELLTIAAGEQYKTRETKQQLEDQLLQKQYGRDSCLIALGGGVVTDITGFVASTYCRGIPCIYIPTSLLAMVDASIGGKTGVNTPFGKNLIGTFYQPKAVFIDTKTLETLPDKEWHNGIAEMIKHSLIADAALFSTMQNHIDKIKNKDKDFLTEMIYANCLIKKNIVEQDEKESGMRQLLNFGHTIGHAIETIENYEIGHGEAVAIGILVESYLSKLCGFLNDNAFQHIVNILQAYELPLKTKAFKNISAIQKLLQLDKKAIGKTARFVLLDNIGRPHLEGQQYSMAVDPALLNKTLTWTQEQFAC